MIWWFKEGISNERLDIILNPSHFLVFNYILDGMMLKRKKILIQGRKFGLKRSCIFKVMNFWSLCPFFQIFIWFFNLFCYWKRGVFYSTDPAEADVVHTSWRGTRASWRGARDQHADSTQHWGHVAGPRVAHATRRWRGHVAGGHAGPRRCPWGAPRGRRVGRWRAHGLLGPCNMIGAVTQ